MNIELVLLHKYILSNSTLMRHPIFDTLFPMLLHFFHTYRRLLGRPMYVARHVAEQNSLPHPHHVPHHAMDYFVDHFHCDYHCHHHHHHHDLCRRALPTNIPQCGWLQCRLGGTRRCWGQTTASVRVLPTAWPGRRAGC